MPSTFIKYRVEFTIEEQDDCGPDEILERVIELTGDDDASVEVVS